MYEQKDNEKQNQQTKEEQEKKQKALFFDCNFEIYVEAIFLEGQCHHSEQCKDNVRLCVKRFCLTKSLIILDVRDT